MPFFDVSDPLNPMTFDPQQFSAEEFYSAPPPYRPAVGTAAGGATVVGCRHRDGTRPATGSTTHKRSY
ncbi:hypothetical protein ACLOJK_041406, partial [Asimina triloba]